MYSQILIIPDRKSLLTVSENKLEWYLESRMAMCPGPLNDIKKIEEADNVMCRAKFSGKNQTCIA